MTTELAGTIPLCLCTRKPPAPSSCRRLRRWSRGHSWWCSTSCCS